LSCDNKRKLYPVVQGCHLGQKLSCEARLIKSETRIMYLKCQKRRHGSAPGWVSRAAMKEKGYPSIMRPLDGHSIFDVSDSHGMESL
jgi:hypothetical protein